jgi:CheY-like chemotaxis protein
MHLDGQAPHILVANHAPEILELMRELLSEAGYRVSTVPRDGQNLDSIVAMEPSLIIIDYMWPSSDNEWTLLNLLRIDRRTREIPVILCTSAVRHVQEMSHHLQRVGVRVVFKPFNIDDLLKQVAEALEDQAASRGAAPQGSE